MRDAFGKITKSVHPKNTTINMTYNNMDLTRLVDRLSFTNQHVYDGFRQRIQAIDPRGGTTSFNFCNCGSLDSTTDPMSKTTSFYYDLQGYRTATTFPSSGSVTNNYNLMHQVTNAIDSAGFSITNWYLNQGLLAMVSNAFGCQQRITFDMENNRTNVCDANTVLNRFAYDELGRTIKRTDPNNQTETFTYSTVGLIAYSNQLGQSITYQYD